MTRLQAAVKAYTDHSRGCPVCSDKVRPLALCPVGEKLMDEFCQALREDASYH